VAQRQQRLEINMKRLFAVLLALAALAGAGVYVWYANHPASQEPMAPVASSDNIFASGEYGFTIRFPKSYQTDYDFKSFYHLPANWRANALPNATGTPIVALIGYRSESDHSFPRYYDAEVRIGISRDPKELARCEVAATEQAEKQLADVTLGGTVFKAFSFESAGMMQYVKGISYRAIHDGACYAVEKLATGSSYRDDPASADDIPQATLDAAYSALDSVAASFQFSK
jgi:hypothetical protein